MNSTQIENILSEHNVLLLARFGSHLYGTATPESDIDYKGIYMPTMKDILLNRVKKSINFDTNKSNEKNSADDIDCELYSIHHFMHLASRGETVGIDLLHVNEENIIHSEPIWDMIQENRGMFYTSEMNAFVGYCRTQAAKYGLRGSRLDAADELLYELNAVDPEIKMENIWMRLPINDHCQFVDGGVNGIHHYNFCGKIVQSTARVGYIKAMVEGFIEKYGHRARLAQKNEGVDWKALSHALRASYQLCEIFEKGDLKFPLTMAERLKRVKRGEIDFNSVIHNLEVSMEEVERLSAKSDFPTSVNKRAIDYLTEICIKEYYSL